MPVARLSQLDLSFLNKFTNTEFTNIGGKKTKNKTPTLQVYMCDMECGKSHVSCQKRKYARKEKMI